MSKLLAVMFAIFLSAAFHAGAATTVYFATLDGASENVPTGSSGTGFARITIDSLLDTMRVESSFAGLGSGVTAAHIHCCTAVPLTGVAGVATTQPTFPGFPSGTSGTYDATFDLTAPGTYNPAFVTANGGTADSAEAVLIAGLNAGKSYFNIHTVNFGSGEIRGFLVAVPKPGTYAMLLAGLGLLGFVMHRRRHNTV